jgi:hypothetical protein
MSNIRQSDSVRAGDAQKEGLTMTIDDARRDYSPTRYEKFRHEFWLVIARCLPKSLIYACALVLGSKANTGKWKDDPELTLLEAYKRFWQPN